MSAKKVPCGSFSACDLAVHREKMSTIIPEIHRRVGDGNGVSASGIEGKDIYKSFKGVFCSTSLASHQVYINEWNCNNKHWIRYTFDHPCDRVRYMYTSHPTRGIGERL